MTNCDHNPEDQVLIHTRNRRKVVCTNCGEEKMLNDEMPEVEQ